MMKKQSGFTLIELAVVIVILIGLAMYGMEGLGNALDFKSRVDTDNRVKAWRKAIESVYLDNSATIDVQTTAILKLVSGTTINPATPATSGASIGKCTMVAANMLEFANRGGYSVTDMIQDGHHNSFCLYITPRISTTVSGTTLFYHSVAIVSPGRIVITKPLQRCSVQSMPTQPTMLHVINQMVPEAFLMIISHVVLQPAQAR